jgi:hypothetical protein
LLPDSLASHGSTATRLDLVNQWSGWYLDDSAQRRIAGQISLGFAT